MTIKLISRSEGDLCVRYKPHTFDEVVGQKAIVKSVRSAVKTKNSSKCYLFHGESGCGKSTMAFIMALALNCDNLDKNGNPCCSCSRCKSIMSGNMPDYKEINAAEAAGIDQARAIIEELKLNPMFGKVKIYVFNEAHGMSSKAQDALLQDMDKMPEGAYIILTSTEPKKIRKPLINRCESYNFKILDRQEISSLIDFVLTLEGKITSNKIKNKIIKKSELRPRNALKLLQVVINIGVSDEDSLLKALEEEDEEHTNIVNLCRAIQNGRYKWEEIMSIYKKIGMDPSSVYVILGSWFKSTLEKTTGRNISPKSRLVKTYNALEFFIGDLPQVRPETRVIHSIFGAWRAYLA